MEALQEWLSVHVDAPRAVLWTAALELMLIALAYLLARAVRWFTRAQTDALIERIDARFRNPRLMSALRPLVVPSVWCGFVLLASLLAQRLGYATALLHSAASLLIAWIVIRATAALVRDPLLSYAIAVIVWMIAAADILGLLDAIAAALDRVALTIGSLRLSLLTVIKATLLLALLLWAASTASRIAQLRINKVTSLTPSIRVLVANLLKITLIVLAVVVALNTVGIDLTALALFSGAVGVGVGLGLQKVVSNFVAGIILLLDRSVKSGDVIETEQTFGRITSMGARYVSVRSRDGKEYLIPNEDLITHRVVNWSYSSRLVRLDVFFGVAYGTDLRKVRELAVAAAARSARILPAPPPACHVTALGESAVNFVLRFWIEDPDNGVTNVKGEVLIAIYETLTEAAIELPFPQYEVRLKTGPRPEVQADLLRRHAAPLDPHAGLGPLADEA
jgi:small-conductance mechanosensitive channel